MSMIHSRQQTYAGIDHEEHHGMTMTGRIIRDAWVFGLLPEGGDHTVLDLDSHRKKKGS